MEQANAEEAFKAFLRDDCGLDDETVGRLIDAGFDDVDSLKLAELGTFQIMGFDNTEQVFKKIKRAISDDSRISLLEQSMGRNSTSILEQGIL